MKKEWLILALIVIGAFLIRQYRINIPLGDWHSWRQADTAAVSRNFVKEGFDFLHPRYDDMAPITQSRPNPERTGSSSTSAACRESRCRHRCALVRYTLESQSRAGRDEASESPGAGARACGLG